MAQINNKASLALAGTVALAIAFPFIGGFEGTKLTTYLDVGGVPTICNGITKGVELGQKATPEECNAMLTSQIKSEITFVDKAVKVPLSDNQLAAFSSFTYNVGDGSFLRSGVLRDINGGRVSAACDDLTRWVFVGKKDCRILSNNCFGIVTRRYAERALCLKEDSHGLASRN